MYLASRPPEKISWDEFRDMFYIYYSSSVRSHKKKEFLALEQRENTSMAEFQVRFLTLERFPPSSFSFERVRTIQFVFGLRTSIRSIVFTFACGTLAEAFMQAL